MPSELSMLPSTSASSNPKFLANVPKPKGASSSKSILAYEEICNVVSQLDSQYWGVELEKEETFSGLDVDEADFPTYYQSKIKENDTYKAALEKALEAEKFIEEQLSQLNCIQSSSLGRSQDPAPGLTLATKIFDFIEKQVADGIIEKDIIQKEIRKRFGPVKETPSTLALAASRPRVRVQSPICRGDECVHIGATCIRQIEDALVVATGSNIELMEPDLLLMDLAEDMSSFHIYVKGYPEEGKEEKLELKWTHANIMKITERFPGISMAN